MGMANQMAKYNPNLAEASAPLRDLLSSKNQWLWLESHETAFQEVKKVIQSPETLKLYDVKHPTKIRVDGSRLNGIAVILYQQHNEKWYPVTCASRYLTKEEKNYYPIENEMLAVLWGCTKMNKYLHGLPHFIAQTDHKPLIPILNTKLLTEMSPRIQDMRMKLMKYNLTAEHVPGKDLEDADALSRAPHQQPSQADIKTQEEINCYVRMVVENMPATTQYLEKVKRETLKDEVLQKLQKVMDEGWPKSKQECTKEVRPYWDSRYDLALIDGMLVKGTRIVIPKTLQQDVLAKVHNAHQGMVGSKRRARQTCYWPGMNNQIEETIEKCAECIRHQASKTAESLQPHPVPTRPWEKIGSDLFELRGQQYIVVTDYYSQWPEVYELKEIKSKQIIAVMKDAFARHGIPNQLVSDNGPQN